MPVIPRVPRQKIGADTSNEFNDRKEGQAPTDQHPLLFHPLCADRLETAIECNLERLAATLQVATSHVKESISMLTSNPTIFEPQESRILLGALHQGLEALNRIQMSASDIGSSLKKHLESISGSIELILDASETVRSRNDIKRQLSEIASELEDKTIPSNKRHILETQKTILTDALQEKNKDMYHRNDSSS